MDNLREVSVTVNKNLLIKKDGNITTKNVDAERNTKPH